MKRYEIVIIDYINNTRTETHEPIFYKDKAIDFLMKNTTMTFHQRLAFADLLFNGLNPWTYVAAVEGHQVDVKGFVVVEEETKKGR